MRIYIIFISLLASLLSSAQRSGFNPTCFPVNWFTGMAQRDFQLLMHAPGIGNTQSVQILSAGLELKGIHKFKNCDYLALDLEVTATTGTNQTVRIAFTQGKNKKIIDYPLQARNPQHLPRGLQASDFIYLIMPDRFANANPANDIIKGMNQQTLQRDSMFHRHGGDLQGIESRLDYLQSLGITALWLNPVQENNQPKESYHGYAITHPYRIDPRLGSNEDYIRLVSKMRERGIKNVMDIVPNHIGNEALIYKQLPDSSWFHFWPKFTRTNYRATIPYDPHAAASEREIFEKGWFDHHMPDLNHNNRFVRHYLTQSYLWWVETAGVDAFRIDTYAYSNPDYLAELAIRLRNEYPEIFLFGEIWDHRVTTQAYYTEKYRARGRFDSHLHAALDFQFCFSTIEALTKEQTWTDGISRLYYTLADDHLYHQPMMQVNFLDNHDISRFYSMVGEDFQKWKVGMAMLLTMRGIPHIYYGTEILMKNFANPDGKVREDFPGGWPGDPKNKFSPEGRTELENQAFDFIANLAQWRKTQPAIAKGKMIHYVPEKQVYVYFRLDPKKPVMVAVNSGAKPEELNLSRFSDFNLQGRQCKEIISGISTHLINKTLPPYSVFIWEIDGSIEMPNE